MKTLENSYCLVTIENIDVLREQVFRDLEACDIGCALFRIYNAFDDCHEWVTWIPEEIGDRTPVTPDQLIDLIHDRITPWRLEEVGFIQCATPDVMMMETQHGVLMVSDIEVWMNDRQVPYNIETFSELQTLIKFKSKKP